MLPNGSTSKRTVSSTGAGAKTDRSNTPIVVSTDKSATTPTTRSRRREAAGVSGRGGGAPSSPCAS